LAASTGKDVAVGVHRQADLGVAEDLHYDPWGDVLDEKERGAGVPQVMEPALR
jgi:hypothetical protein